jgi:hypothetical protein
MPHRWRTNFTVATRNGEPNEAFYVSWVCFMEYKDFACHVDLFQLTFAWNMRHKPLAQQQRDKLLK